MNGTQRRTLVNPMKNALYLLWYAKGTSQAEATLSSEKLQLVALAIIKLRLSEGIRQSVSEIKKKLFLNSMATF